MKSKRIAGAARRERRTFSSEFKAEAVRLVAERRAMGVTLADVGQELDVRPDQLRAWTRQARTAPRSGGAGPGESIDQEVRRLRREVAVLRQEQAFAKKKWRCTSRKSRVEVRRDHAPPARVQSATHVSSPRGHALGVLRLAEAPAELARTLAAYGMLASMSRKGDCYDNAVAESFFSTLEFELLSQNDWRTREDARHALFRYIEGWYNPRRRHSTLGYLSPAAYDEQLREAA